VPKAAGATPLQHSRGSTRCDNSRRRWSGQHLDLLTAPLMRQQSSWNRGGIEKKPALAGFSSGGETARQPARAGGHFRVCAIATYLPRLYTYRARCTVVSKAWRPDGKTRHQHSTVVWRCTRLRFSDTVGHASNRHQNTSARVSNAMLYAHGPDSSWKDVANTEPAVDGRFAETTNID
jgi:hypothetical protein